MPTIAKYTDIRCIWCGGSGQLAALHALRRGLLLGTVPHHTIVDADTDVGRPIAAALNRQLTAKGKPRYEAIVRRPAETKARVNPNEDVVNLALRTLGKVPEQVLFEAALASVERTEDVQRGFFGRPRLGAAWLGKWGLDPKLEVDTPEILGTPGAIVVVGGLSGGMGPAALAWLLRRLRAGDPTLWQRDLFVVALLPYFNAEKGGTPAAGTRRVTWEEQRRNAGQGLKALLEAFGEVQTEATKATTAIKRRTVLVIAGPEPEWAQTQAAPHGEALEQPTLDDILDGVQELIRPLAEEEGAGAAFSILAPTGESYDNDGPEPAAAPRPWERLTAAFERNVRAVKRRDQVGRVLAAIAGLDLERGVARWAPTRWGYGRVLGDVLAMAKGGRLSADFAEALKRALEDRGSSTCVGVAESALTPAQILTRLENAVHIDDPEWEEMLKWADFHSLRQDDVAERAKKAAASLERLVERYWPSAESDAAGAAPGRRVALAPAPAPQLVAGRCSYTDQQLLELAATYDAVQGVCRALGRPSTLSTGRALAELVGTQPDWTVPVSSPLEDVVTLWEAAVLDRLTFNSVDPGAIRGSERLSDYVDADGQLLLLGADQGVIGYWAPFLGPIPLADAVDNDIAEEQREPARKRLTDLAAAGAPDRLSARAVLAHLARSSPPNEFAKRPAWQRLLWNLSEHPSDAPVHGAQVPLADRGAVRLPQVVRDEVQKALRRVEHARAEDNKLIVVSQAADGRKVVEFQAPPPYPADPLYDLVDGKPQDLKQKALLTAASAFRRV